MKRIKQIKIKSRSNQFAKTYKNQGTEKTVHEKIWKNFEILEKLVEEKFSLKMMKSIQLTIKDLIN